jgi:hypothetical protein
MLVVASAAAITGAAVGNVLCGMNRERLPCGNAALRAQACRKQRGVSGLLCNLGRR